MISSNKIRWGILGTGGMAHNFAEALMEVEDAQLVAIASRSQISADRFGDQFSVPHRYAGYEKLARDSEVDVVYIATPHSQHKDQSILCLQAGKAVLCEKPFCINAKQAQELIALAREKNLFLMEAMWTRCLPAIAKLNELLSQKIIGDVQIMLGGGAYMPEFDPEYYLFNPDLGGGILLDAGVYLVAMASMLFGQPIKIQATGALGETGVDEHEAILLTHAKGEIANLYVSHRAKSSPDLTLLGSKGKIYLHPPVFCPSKITVSVPGETDSVFDFTDVRSGYRHEIIEVNRCLKQGKTESDLMALDETLAIMRTMDEIRHQIGLRYPGEAEAL